MQIHFQRAALAAALLLAGGLFGVHAEAPPAAAASQGVPNVSDSAEQKIISHIQENSQARLKGWPGMIFYCPADEAKTPEFRQICVETYQNLENLATQQGVKFHKARNANDVTLLPHLTGRLKLVIDLNGTDAGASPTAVAARVSVLAHYAHAVSRSVELNAVEGVKHPLNVPQHLDAVLWEAEVVKAAAAQDQLVKPVVDALHEKLKVFFAEYAKANQ
jgi:hypothetical protein